MGIGLVSDELEANGNPKAEFVFTEPSSFKVIVKSADPLEEHIGTNPGLPKANLEQIDTNRYKSLEQMLIQIVSENRTISKVNLAHELGIGRSTLYRLLERLQHQVTSTGGTRHTEWTILDD